MSLANQSCSEANVLIYAKHFVSNIARAAVCMNAGSGDLGDALLHDLVF